MTSLERARRVWDTLRPLSPAQIAWRLVRSLQRRLPLPSPRPTASLRTSLVSLEEEVRAWAPTDAASRRERVRHLMAGRFDFVGITRDMGTADWTGHPVSPLWTYNLHYFDFATDLAWAVALDGDTQALDQLLSLVDGWITATAGARGPGWEPYPLATRIMNWAKVLLIVGDGLPRDFRQRMAASMHHQLRVLRARLEWDIRANHLQRDLSALMLGSLLFDGQEAATWGASARRWLVAEVQKQVLPDGGHYERSPMYQAIVAMDLMEVALLCRAARIPLTAETTGRITSLARALGVFMRADGSLHLLNDAANGIAPPLPDLHARATRLDVNIEVPNGAWAMPQTGYWGRNEIPAGRALIVDAGPAGPDEQPGHAHCDMLSFELDAGGMPFVVDSGVHGYDGDPFREYSRSTRAHNTVMIDGREQSEFWGTFRLARRARITGASADSTSDGWKFRGGYVPYYDTRLRHDREISWRGHEIVVQDTISGNAPDTLSFVHLHPACQVERTGDEVIVRRGGVAVSVAPFAATLVDVVRGVREPAQGWYLPRFGQAEDASVLVYRASSASVPFGYRIRFLEG